MKECCARKTRIVFVGLVLLSALILLAATSSASTSATAKSKIGRIYVGTMGDNDDAEQFRVMLQYELGRVGFKVVDFAPQADSVLTGLITDRVVGGKATSRVTVFLNGRNGKRIWTGESSGTPGEARSVEDIFRLRAQDIARSLKRYAAKPAIAGQ